MSAVFRRGRWWRPGACGPCGRGAALVTWAGAVRDESAPARHRHVFVCEGCVAPYDQPEPEPEPDPAPAPVSLLLPPLTLPAPPMPRGEWWLNVVNTALSIISVIFAGVAFWIAQGAN
ncbi:hypothetical protein [Streptomyces sp. 6N223]|uniref:hypothetical protein n=1 Tax=Streptomyces sp. 6N223 TaxID=3457412 RepID=UPI003FD350A8